MERDAEDGSGEEGNAEDGEEGNGEEGNGEEGNGEEIIVEGIGYNVNLPPAQRAQLARQLSQLAQLISRQHLLPANLPASAVTAVPPGTPDEVFDPISYGIGFQDGYAAGFERGYTGP